LFVPTLESEAQRFAQKIFTAAALAAAHWNREPKRSGAHAVRDFRRSMPEFIELIEDLWKQTWDSARITNIPTGRRLPLDQLRPTEELAAQAVVPITPKSDTVSGHDGLRFRQSVIIWHTQELDGQQAAVE
jgi:hypothetical protein